MASIWTEHTARVYENNRSFYVEVSPDNDGLNLCHIAYIESDSTLQEIIITWEMAEQVAEAIKNMRPLNVQEQA